MCTTYTNPHKRLEITSISMFCDCTRLFLSSFGRNVSGLSRAAAGPQAWTSALCAAASEELAFFYALRRWAASEELDLKPIVPRAPLRDSTKRQARSPKLRFCVWGILLPTGRRLCLRKMTTPRCSQVMRFGHAVRATCCHAAPHSKNIADGQQIILQISGVPGGGCGRVEALTHPAPTHSRVRYSEGRIRQ